MGNFFTQFHLNLTHLISDVSEFLKEYLTLSMIVKCEKVTVTYIIHFRWRPHMMSCTHGQGPLC